MRVALVHDWLTGYRGGEKCLQALLSVYPEADVYTLIHVPGRTTKQIDEAVRGVSFLSRLPFVPKYYRVLLPLYPMAASTLDLSGYDLVVSISHAAAKNVRTGPSTRHICYCLTPIRYVWDLARSYFGRGTPLVWPLLTQLRRWDREGSRRVDHFVAISEFVAARIRCFYGRRASVIYPPVDTSWIRGPEGNVSGAGEAFLCAGALVPYKQVDLAIRAFNKLKLPLWVVGGGPEERRLRRLAGPTITFFGHVSDQELADYYRRCRALVFPGLEDFGLVPVECMAAGRPVIGLYGGGCKESLVGFKPWDPLYNSKLDARRATGVFIRRSVRNGLEAILESVSFFLEHESVFSGEACLKRADLFSLRTFLDAWADLIDSGGVAGTAPAEEPLEVAQGIK